MYKIEITETAYMQIDKAYDWYEIKRAGLGHVFFVSVQDSLKMVAQNPFLFAYVYQKVRRVLTKKFPYSIFYRVDEANKTVEVIAVRHQAENMNWLDKS